MVIIKVQSSNLRPFVTGNSRIFVSAIVAPSIFLGGAVKWSKNWGLSENSRLEGT